jgi:amino acid transporter
MIQRLQSLYLFAISLLSIVMLATNMEMINGNGSSTDLIKKYSIGAISNAYTYTAESTANIPDYMRIVCFCLMGIYAFIILLLFKNLKQQFKFARLNYVLTMLSILAIYSSIYKATIGLNGNSEQNYTLALFLPLLALVFNFLACRGIKRDIDLIGSADRLR